MRVCFPQFVLISVLPSSTYSMLSVRRFNCCCKLVVAGVFWFGHAWVVASCLALASRRVFGFGWSVIPLYFHQSFPRKMSPLSYLHRQYCRSEAGRQTDTNSHPQRSFDNDRANLALKGVLSRTRIVSR